MRVLHLITGLNQGGAEQMLARLVAHSDRTRFNHVVVSMLDFGPIGRQIESQGVRVHALGMKAGKPNMRALGRLVSLIRGESPDVLQTWMYHADLLGTAAYWFARRPILAWNLRCSDVDSSAYSGLFSWTRWACARLSSVPAAVVVNAAAGREFHARIGYRPKRWALIRNGIDTGVFRANDLDRQAVRGVLGVQETDVLIGLIARVDPMKDHDTFFRAAGIVARQKERARFLLVGEGATAANPVISAAIEREGLKGRTQLLGRRSDVARILPSLDIAVLSSKFGEGFPNAVAEAMACEVPCVATDVGDAAHIIGPTGVIVPPGNSTALAEGIDALIRLDKYERQRLGREARERVLARFNLASAVREYEALYASLLENRCVA